MRRRAVSLGLCKAWRDGRNWLATKRREWRLPSSNCFAGTGADAQNDQCVARLARSSGIPDRGVVRNSDPGAHAQLEAIGDFDDFSEHGLAMAARLKSPPSRRSRVWPGLRGRHIEYCDVDVSGAREFAADFRGAPGDGQ
jgi:hypothetical protein